MTRRLSVSVLLLGTTFTLIGCGKPTAVVSIAAVEADPSGKPAPPVQESLLDRWVKNLVRSKGESRGKAMDALVKIDEADEGIDVIPALIAMLDDRGNDGPGQYFADWPSSSREAAVMTLLRLKNKGEAAIASQGLAKLQGHLTDQDALIREHTIHALGRLQKRATPASEILIKSLADKDNFVRRAAYRAMKEIAPIPPKDLVPLLVASDAGVRSDAAEAISGQTLKADALPMLLQALKDPDAFVRNTAAELIGKLGAEAKSAIPDLIAIVEDLKESDIKGARSYNDLGALDALRKIGGPAVEPLSTLLESPNYVCRYVAANTLGRMGLTAKSAHPKLVELMNNEKKIVDVACEAAAAQVFIGGPIAEPVAFLEGLLSHEEALVRMTAARTIAQLGKPASSVVPKLVLALNDPDEGVRRVAIEALKRMGSAAKPAIKTLGPRLTDDQASVRTAAAEILRGMGPAVKEAIGDMSDALAGEDSNVRKLVAETLARLGPDAKPALPALIKALGTKEYDAYQRTAIADAIGAIGVAATSASPTLLTLLDHPDPILRASVARALGRVQPPADQAVPKLLTMIAKDSNSNVRIAAIFALGKMGPAATAAVEPLKAMFDSTNTPGERKVAIGAALSRIVPAEKAKYQASIFESLRDHSSRSLAVIQRNVALDMLELIGPDAKPAVPDLIELTRDRVPEQRIRVALTIGRLGGMATPAIPALISLLKDGDAPVRRAAMEAIEQIGPAAKAAGSRLRELARSDNENAAIANRVSEAVDPLP